MPRPSIDSFWRRQVRIITANTKHGPGRVEQELERIGAAVGRTDWPSLRTIGRMQAEFREAEESERRAYLDFHWPDGLEESDLPWEAGEVAIEAMRLLHTGDHRLGLFAPTGRLSISTVRWLWRLTVAQPEMPLPTRLLLALAMAHSDSEVRHSVEAWLVAGRTFTGNYFGSHVAIPAQQVLLTLTSVQANEDRDAAVEALAEWWKSGWQRELTEKEAFTVEQTDGGARRSRSKGSGSTSSRKTAKKSRGS